ncbi:class I SAM-dependent methyltransferase [Methylomagnum sp.]
MASYAAVVPDSVLPQAALPWTCPECRQPLSPTVTGYGCATCEFTLSESAGVWSSDTNFTPEGFSHASQAHLQALEAQHFWFKPRARLFERILRERLRPGCHAAIELGCGNGAFLPVLARHFKRVVGVEGHSRSLALARQQTPPNATLLHGAASHVPLSDSMFDLACAFDVLEHLPPDPFLAEVRRLLRPGGLLLLSVPAFQALWSVVDEQAGHRCRYRLAQARTELEGAGFRVVGHTHYQCLLFPLISMSRRLASGRGRNNLEARPALPLGRLLGSINQLEVALFAKRSLPFGSSLIVWSEVLK